MSDSDPIETDIRDSDPNADAPAGEAANGVRDTSADSDPASDADVPPEQRPGQVESNPEGLEPKRTRE